MAIEEEIAAEAEWRYLFDAAFHARATIAMNIAEREKTQVRHSLAWVVAVALEMADRDPVTGEKTR